MGEGEYTKQGSKKVLEREREREGGGGGGGGVVVLVGRD